MKQFEVVRELRTLAENNEWLFLSGDKFAQNISAIRKSIDSGQLALEAQLINFTPTTVNSVITQISYTLEIGLGRKFDPKGDTASIRETFLEKYDNRLEELSKLFVSTIIGFGCDNELDVSFGTLAYALDVTAQDIDFVVGEVTLTQY
jgi:hypothetical protein